MLIFQIEENHLFCYHALKAAIHIYGLNRFNLTVWQIPSMYCKASDIALTHTKKNILDVLNKGKAQGCLSNDEYNVMVITIKPADKGAGILAINCTV